MNLASITTFEASVSGCHTSEVAWARFTATLQLASNADTNTHENGGSFTLTGSLVLHWSYFIGTVITFTEHLLRTAEVSPETG